MEQISPRYPESKKHKRYKLLGTLARHTKNTKRGTVTLCCETVVLVWFQVTNLEHAFELSFEESTVKNEACKRSSTQVKMAWYPWRHLGIYRAFVTF